VRLIFSALLLVLLLAALDQTIVSAALHHAYVDAGAAALHPVFLVAAAVMLVGFAFTWLLKDVPLRTTAATENARSTSTAARLA
jgi:hypothetical protein